MLRFIGVILAIVIGAQLAYGFVFWVVWRIAFAFSGANANEPIATAGIAIAASILCFAVIHAIATDDAARMRK